MTPKRRFRTIFQSKDEEDLSDISDISCPDPPELQPSKSKKKTKKKRHKFTHSEDREILNFIMKENRYNEIKGLALWKDMEVLKITNHTKQSMKCRFLKTIIPNLHQYDISKTWVIKLRRLFPELLGKNPDKENAKSNSPHGSILARWRRQTPGLRTSPQLPASNATKTPEEENDVSEEDEAGSDNEARHSPVSEKEQQKGESCGLKSSSRFPANATTKTVEESDISEGDEAVGNNNEPCNSSSLGKQKCQSPGVRSSSPPPANDSKKTGKESDISEDEDPNADNDSSNMEATIPYTESPYFPRRRKRRIYTSLCFNSSSESEVEEQQVERNDSPPCAAADPSVSPDASPSRSAENVAKDNNGSEQSELSDYDQYLMEIAKKTSSGGKNSSKSEENGSQLNKDNTTNDEYVQESEEEISQDDSLNITEDRRSRLQRRRHIKKVQKAFGAYAISSESPQKKGKKTNLAEFVTNSYPEETLNENKDESSPEKPGKLREYRTIISDIAQSYGLTNREVLSTIFSFNGSIDKTISYISLGPEMSGLKPWSEEEDQIISSTDEPSIKTIAQKRGNKFIAERLQFLEYFTEDILS